MAVATEGGRAGAREARCVVTERFDIDVGYRDPDDRRDDFPDDKPSPAEYEDDLVGTRWELLEQVSYQGDPDCLHPSHSHRYAADQMVPGCFDYHCPRCGEPCPMTGHDCDLPT